MTETAAAQREKARRLYADVSVSLQAAAVELGISRSTLVNWARREGWPPRPARRKAGASAAVEAPAADQPAIADETDTHRAAPLQAAVEQQGPPQKQRAGPEASGDRKDLIDRLYRLVHHNVKILESRMSDENASDASGPERDMRVVGNLVRSVEKLKELEPEQSKRDNSGAGAARAVLSAEEEDIIRRRVVEHILKLRERKRRQGGDR